MENKHQQYRIWDKGNNCYAESDTYNHITPSGGLTSIGQDAYGDDCFCDTDELVVEFNTGLEDNYAQPMFENDKLEVRNASKTVLERGFVKFMRGCYWFVQKDRNISMPLFRLFDDGWCIKVTGRETLKD